MAQQDEGDASVPSHLLRHSRPYVYEAASKAMLPITYPCKAEPLWSPAPGMGKVLILQKESVRE